MDRFIVGTNTSKNTEEVAYWQETYRVTTFIMCIQKCEKKSNKKRQGQNWWESYHTEEKAPHSQSGSRITKCYVDDLYQQKKAKKKETSWNKKIAGSFLGLKERKKHQYLEERANNCEHRGLFFFFNYKVDLKNFFLKIRLLDLLKLQWKQKDILKVHLFFNLLHTFGSTFIKVRRDILAAKIKMGTTASHKFSQ